MPVSAVRPGSRDRWGNRGFRGRPAPRGLGEKRAAPVLRGNRERRGRRE
ncbi:hypothetical protein F220043C3_06360 [Enterocloster asparagiformis]